METLTAYVRERAPWPPTQALANPFVDLQGSSVGEKAGQKPENEAEPASIKVRPATDIQAVLTVLGRRDEQERKRDDAAKRYLYLAGTDLRGARLWKAHLEGTNLPGAHLEGANLRGAHLVFANLRGAHLERADLGKAHLKHAQLWGAHLEGADLGKAVGLTQEQLEMTFGDDYTCLPDNLTPPSRWKATPGSAAG